MNSQEMMEEIDRLARLCEAKDAEIAETKQAFRIVEEAMRMVKEQLSEAQAQIAMKDEALRREVAMLYKAAEGYLADKKLYENAFSIWHELGDGHDEVCSAERAFATSELIFARALSDTQATALAYEREVKAKALEDAAKSMQHRRFELPSDAHDELIEMAAELRAVNKGDSK